MRSWRSIQIIWERDAGILNKAPGHPDPALGPDHRQAFAAGVKCLVQAVVVIVIAALLGVAAVVVLGSACFSCLSITIAGIVLNRDRLMGFGQAITMAPFFGSNALYPLSVMPGRLQAVSKANPLSYQVDALRGLLLGTPAHRALDFAVLLVAAALGIAAASSLILVRNVMCGTWPNSAAGPESGFLLPTA